MFYFSFPFCYFFFFLVLNSMLHQALCVLFGYCAWHWRFWCMRAMHIFVHPAKLSNRQPIYININDWEKTTSKKKIAKKKWKRKKYKWCACTLWQGIGTEQNKKLNEKRRERWEHLARPNMFFRNERIRERTSWYVISNVQCELPVTWQFEMHYSWLAFETVYHFTRIWILWYEIVCSDKSKKHSDERKELQWENVYVERNIEIAFLFLSLLYCVVVYVRSY